MVEFFFGGETGCFLLAIIYSPCFLAHDTDIRKEGVSGSVAQRWKLLVIRWGKRWGRA